MSSVNIDTLKIDAEKGSISSMRTLVTMLISSAIDKKDPVPFDQALSWYLRLLLRLRQDIPLSRDKSVASAVGHVQFENGPLFQTAVNLNESFGELTREDKMMEKMIGAYRWGKKLTDEDILPPPYEISQFGMNGFLRHIDPSNKNYQDQYVDKEEWKKIRSGVIDDYAKQLNIE